MSNDQKQIVEQLTNANSILVTVSSDPSVDQLAASIGLSLFLNNLDKHAIVVFSGKIPSTIEFLKPEQTIEKNTDSLRDFIIALDKSKADKLRYKVEDKHVKIFITPYKTTLKSSDLTFSQGDFNVDTVVTLGVHQQKDLDKAIVAHGQILHDATVISVNTTEGAALGTINWAEPNTSSICELVVEVCESLKENSFDAQTATALLTGIVAETDRFSNDKTKSTTMSVSSRLMAAGANQQLVAMKLHSPKVEPDDLPKQPEKADTTTKSDKEEKQKEKSQDGDLLISHDDENTSGKKQEKEQPEEAQKEDDDEKDQSSEQTEADEKPSDHDEIHIDEAGTIRPNKTQPPPGSSIMTEPPILNGTLTSNTKPEALDPSSDPLSAQNSGPILRRDVTDYSQDEKDEDPGKQTLEEIERAFDSPHLKDKSSDKKDKDEDSKAQDGQVQDNQGQDKQDQNNNDDLPPPVPPPFLPED